MSIRSLEQGIQAVNSGKLEEGARLLRIALKDETLDASIRATALMWLAETNPDMQFKIDCYRQANTVDPTNQLVNQRLSALLAAQLPPQQPVPGNTPSQGMPPASPYTVPGTAYVQQPVPGNTPSQGMPPVSPYPQNTPPYGNPPVNPYQTGTMPAAQPVPGNTPSQGMLPVNPYQTGTMPAAQPAAGMPGMPQPPTQKLMIQGIQRTVGVIGGPNGRGTGFFVTHDGLIATTRYVTGGESDLEIELLTGQRMGGKVVRAFPKFDLALIQVNATVPQLMPVTQMPLLPENATIVAITHTGEGLRSTRRETRHETPAYWFPTLINHLRDAGGNPVFDAQNLLVGMMTRNASRANGYMYGLHITMIYKCVDQYLQEVQQMAGQGAYCRHCGSASRAGVFGAYYCETCGAVLPASLEITRHPMPNVGALYGENMNRPCPHCRATVGYYNGQCLRCGQDVTGKI